MQYVCKKCGYNMIGHKPDNCPFCGAEPELFLTSDECSEKYKVQMTQVKESVYSLKSHPPLGFDHLAYFLKAPAHNYMIDCPSSFDSDLPAVNTLYFTHHHFLGASNLYCEYFQCDTGINQKDAVSSLAEKHHFDFHLPFSKEDGALEMYHVNGHTPGFTIFIFKECLFVCDYVMLENNRLYYNYFGDPVQTQKGGQKISEIINQRKLEYVCGWNYVMPFDKWKDLFKTLQ